MSESQEEEAAFVLDGKKYLINDFELGELEWLEDELGASLSQIDWGAMKAAVRIVYLIKRRENPEFTLEDARKVRMGAFEDAEEAPVKRPTRRKG